MTREVYANKEFVEFSRSQVFVRLFVDTDSQGDRLARKFGVRRYPTLIVLDRAGRELDRLAGARSAQRLKADLESIFDAAGPDEEVSEQAPVQIPSQGKQSPPREATEVSPVAVSNPPPATKAVMQSEKKPTDPTGSVEPNKTAIEDPITRLEGSLAAAKDEAERQWLLMMLGLAHFQAQHWKEAKVYISQILDKDPSNATARDLMNALENK